MLAKPNCYKRKCKNYLGVKSTLSEEDDEMKTEVDGRVNYCGAFPNGIPDEIAYGDNLHLKPLRKQDNDFVYEQE